MSCLAALGVTCIWLLSFYPSPRRDNGYDVKDYLGVPPELGDLGDFAAFMDEATDRGVRVIIDLVVNHTSDQHPSPEADCYSKLLGELVELQRQQHKVLGGFSRESILASFVTQTITST